jgi:acetyl esterase/lipase
MKEGLSASEKRLVAELGPPDDLLEESYYEITLSDGYKLNSKLWWRKETPSSPRPLILFFHGGGFQGGSCEQGTRPGREFALEFDAVVVSIDYRLSPEYKFPQAHLDGLEVAEWMTKNAEQEFSADLKSGFVVGGHSAGAQIAAALASEARTRDLAYPITGSFICISIFFTPETVPEKYKDVYKAWEENGEGPMGQEPVLRMLSTTGADVASALFCPANSPLGLEGLPKTYLQAGGKDVTRDDSVIYERLLRDAGVPTKIDVYDDINHEVSCWGRENGELVPLLTEPGLLYMDQR